MCKSFQGIGGDSIIGMHLRKMKEEKLQIRDRDQSLNIFCSKDKQRNDAMNAGGKKVKGVYFLFSLEKNVAFSFPIESNDSRKRGHNWSHIY